MTLDLVLKLLDILHGFGRLFGVVHIILLTAIRFSMQRQFNLYHEGDSLSRDIFQFWSEIPDDACEHPADRQVLQHIKHNFAPDCLPQAYRGRLRTAPVVLLFLSPGLDPDDPAHCADGKGRRYYAGQRTGECDLPEEKDHPSAYRWLSKIVRQFGINYEQALSTVATLNIGAYKSVKFDDWPMLAALPSSRVCLDWAQSVLFPQAEAGERVVVCLRSPKYWGLGKDEGVGSLYCPPCTRGAIMLRGDMRDRVTNAVKDAVESHAKR